MTQFWFLVLNQIKERLHSFNLSSKAGHVGGRVTKLHLLSSRNPTVSVLFLGAPWVSPLTLTSYFGCSTHPLVRKNKLGYHTFLTVNTV